MGDEASPAVLAPRGAARPESLLAPPDGGLLLLAPGWHLASRLLCAAVADLHAAIGPPDTFRGPPLPASFDPAGARAEMEFAFGAPLLGEALAAGRSRTPALRLFSVLRRGRPRGRGLGFVPERSKGVLAGSRRLTGDLVSMADPSTVASALFSDAGIVFGSGSRAAPGPARHVRDPPPASVVQKQTRRLPEHARLPRDASGMLIHLAPLATSLVERRHARERLIVIDGATRAIVSGKLCYSRACRRTTPSYLPIHTSWEAAGVNEMLGKKAARYFRQGATEPVPPGRPLPTIIEPSGSVPEKGPDRHRDIADGREGNKSFADWGSRLFTARDLAAALSQRPSVHGLDTSDGHHFAGPRPPHRPPARFCGRSSRPCSAPSPGTRPPPAGRR